MNAAATPRPRDGVGGERRPSTPDGLPPADLAGFALLGIPPELLGTVAFRKSKSHDTTLIRPSLTDLGIN